MSDSTLDTSMNECPYWIEHRPVRKTLDNWEPVSRQSQVVQTLIEKLRNQHNTCVSEICTNLTRINQEIESDIRIKADGLKHDLNVYRTTGDNAINNLACSQTEITHFDETEFVKIRLFCMNLIQQAKSKINRYCAFLEELENYRAGKFKVILQTGYMNTQKCCYKLPYEMQQFFENQIIHINQMLLANLRNYKELHGHLCLTFNNDIKLMIYKITQYEMEWKELCRNEIMTRFKEHDIPEEEFEELWRNTESMSALVKSADERLNKQIENKQLASQLKEVHDAEWCKDMEAIVENIKTSSISLAKIYAETIQQLDTNDFILDDLESEFLKIQIKESLELEELETPNAESYQILWQNTLQSIVKYLHTHHYTYISKVFDTWEKHMRREEANKSTVLDNLEQITQKHDTALQNKHGKTLDKAMNTLRQQTDEKALQKSYKTVCTTLDKIKHMMKGNNDVELKTINKYNEYVNKENELLTKELKELDGKSAGNDARIGGFDGELRNDKTLVLFDKLQLCEDGFCELKEHRNKLQESLYQYIKSSSLVDQQRAQASRWTAMETEKHVKNLENKLVTHEQRYDSIRLELYDVRLRDIREHAAQFSNHQTSVEHRVQLLRNNIRTFEAQLRPGIDEMTDALEDLCTESRRAKYSAHAATYLIRAAKLVDRQIQVVKEQVHSYHERCNGDVDELLKDNDQYRLQIKTFTDGGSYSTKEANSLMKKLQQLDTYCRKKSAELKQEITEVEKYIIKDIHHISPSYTKVLENILNTAKCQENSAMQLAAVQKELKNEVYVLKYKRKRIDAINQQIQSQMEASNELSRGGEFLIKYSKELAGQCKEYSEYLKQTAVPSLVKPAALEENLTQRSTSKGKKSPKNKRKNIVEFKDYTNQLFDAFTISGDSKQFIPSICNILYTALRNMQASAKDFYSKTILHDLENISVASNYDEYMLEVLNKLKYYYIQCVQLWIDEVQYFINITNEIPTLINQYCNITLLHVHDLQMDKMATEYKGYLARVRETSLCKINDVRIQLKPLHGYHGNKQLLDDLVKQMVEVQTTVKHEISVSLSKYEEDLEGSRKEYHNIMSRVKDFTDSLRTVSEEYKYDTGLSEQAVECLMVLKSLNITDSPGESIISTTRDCLKHFENTSAFADINLDILHQSFEEELSDQSVKIDAFRTQLYNDLSTLEVIWTNDLDKILQLYTVTYE